MYANAKSCVRNNGFVSDMFSSSRGVRQGENLSPLLFALYLNDLRSHLSSCVDGLQIAKEVLYPNLNNDDSWVDLLLLLYADDTIILAESAENLQKGLDGLQEYCDRWDLKVNINKTKIMVFSKGCIRNKPQFSFKKELIEVCDEFIYLGVKFICTGSFKPAIEALSQQANNAMFALLSKGRKLLLSTDVMLHLFDSTVLPILLYGCEVWGYEDYTVANTLYLKFCKILLGLKKSTNTCMVLGELGRLPLCHFVNQRVINFWAQLINDDRNKISSMLIKCLTSMKGSSDWNFPWLDFVHDLLDNAGMSYVWQRPNTISCNYLKKAYSLRSADICKQNWLCNVRESKKCDIYRIIGKELKFEKYLFDLPWLYASQICRLRTSNHRLPVEIGRYTHTLRENRICVLCDLKAIGDEYHYIMECKHFLVEREQYLNITSSSLNKITIFERLLNSDDKKVLLNLSKFIKIIFKQF